MFEGKNILITGGTGSLGQALTRRLLDFKVGTVRIFSRNEDKQITMESEFNDDRLRFFIGDVRDLPRLDMALEDVDIVFHAAALKHVPVVEYNPFEAIKTNVVGSQNVIDSCIKRGVELAVCVGTDKAVSPLNTYGATKLLMEKLFVTAKNFTKAETKFIALRYGNVLASSGSVVPKFIRQIQEGKKITVTDPNMTRFSISMEEALDFILESAKIGKGSEIFVPKLRAYTINDVKKALVELFGDTGEEVIGIRPGEKMFEILINQDEMRYTWETDNKYVVFNPLLSPDEIKKSYSNVKKVESVEPYTSDSVEKIPIEELKKSISKYVVPK